MQEKTGHAHSILPVRVASCHATSSHFWSGPLALPVTSDHVTDVSSGHVTGRSRDFRYQPRTAPPQILTELRPYTTVVTIYISIFLPGYNSWSSWTKCSTTCDIGRSMRRRTCDNPIHCEDGNFEIKLCLHKRCHKRKHGHHNN